MISFKEIRLAWNLVHGIKWHVFKFVLVLMFLPFITQELIYKDVPTYIDNFILGVITISLSLTILNIITSYAILCIVLTGIRQVQHKPISTQEIKKDMSKNEIMVFFLIAVSILYQIPFIEIFPIIMRSPLFDLIYILISSYLYIPLFLFSMPFAIYKHQNFKSAFINGYKMLKYTWKEITCCLVIPNLILIEFTIWGNQRTLNINEPIYFWIFIFLLYFSFLIWMIPFFANIGGIIYTNAERLKPN